MPRRRAKIEPPPGATPEQLALVRYLNEHPNLTVNGWTKKAGCRESTVRNFLKGQTHTMHYRTFKLLADAEGKTVEELLGFSLASKTYLAGRVTTGAEVQLFDGGAMDDMTEEIDRAGNISKDGLVVALEIHDNAMMPIKNGWGVFYRPDNDENPATLIGHLCVVKLRGGRVLVREIARGYSAGRFNLVGWNAPTMEDQEIESAYEVLSIAPVLRR